MWSMPGGDRKVEEAALLERLEPELDAAHKIARDALDQLDRSHALVADRSDISLRRSDR